MSISGINNLNSRNLYTNYQQLSSGKRINSAADDASGLSIARSCKARATAMMWADGMLPPLRIW